MIYAKLSNTGKVKRKLESAEEECSQEQQRKRARLTQNDDGEGMEVDKVESGKEGGAPDGMFNRYN